MMKKRMKLLCKKQFNPELRYYELEYLLGSTGLEEKKIENILIYNLVKRLTDLAFPTIRYGKFDKRWFDFYLPLKRNGHLISLPFGIVKYPRRFFACFHQLGNLQIKIGREKIEKEYKTIFEETLRFIPLIKKTKNKILKKTIPYDIRTGKILGKYILGRLMPKKEKEKIFQDYQTHLKKGLKIFQISLNEYLDVASICYQAAYSKKTKNLSPIKMYKKWADGRDGGMLSIKNWDSKKEFRDWQKSGKWAGSHPFEIVFSWHRHGIHLYPPDTYSSYYSLYVTNYAYVWDFIKMIIPFQTKDLNDVLDYLTGDSYFSVNSYDDHFFHYIPSREYKKLYFNHIKWDEIKVPTWKK